VLRKSELLHFFNLSQSQRCCFATARWGREYLVEFEPCEELYLVTCDDKIKYPIVGTGCVTTDRCTHDPTDFLIFISHLPPSPIFTVVRVGDGGKKIGGG